MEQQSLSISSILISNKKFKNQKFTLSILVLLLVSSHW